MKTRVIFDKQMADERGWKPEEGDAYLSCDMYSSPRPYIHWNLIRTPSFNEGCIYSRMVEVSPVLTAEDIVKILGEDAYLMNIGCATFAEQIKALLAQRQAAPQGRRFTAEKLKQLAAENNVELPANDWHDLDCFVADLNALTSQPEAATQEQDEPEDRVAFLMGRTGPPKAAEEWEYAWGFAAIEAGWDYNDCTVVTIEPAGIGELKFHARVTGFTDKDIYRRPKPAQPKCVCRRCGKSALEIDGYLERVNEKGVEGIWGCRPLCAQPTIMEAMARPSPVIVLGGKPTSLLPLPSPVAEGAPDGEWELFGIGDMILPGDELLNSKGAWEAATTSTHSKSQHSIFRRRKPVATVEQETMTVVEAEEVGGDITMSLLAHQTLINQRNTLRAQLAEAMSAKEDAINRRAEQMARADGLQQERDELKQKVGEEKAINRFLTATNDKLTERSVGAMAIAAKEEGWENVPLDCPMLAAVEQLRRHCDDLKKDIGQVDAALGNVAAFDDCKDRPAKIRKAMLTAAQVEKLTAENERLTRELELKERARVIAVASLFSCAEELDALKASLAWVLVTPETMPKESDADRNGCVAVLFENSQIMSLQWKDLADHITEAGTHWRPTNLPEPKQEAEDGAEAAFEKDAAGVIADNWQELKSMFIRGFRAAKSEGGKA